MAIRESIVSWRKFYITVVSAENIPDVRKVFETKAYAKVSIGSGSDEISYKTSADNGLCPKWNRRFKFDVPESDMLDCGLKLVIDLYCKRTLFDDRYIGGVEIAMKYLYEQHAYLRGGCAELSLPIFAKGCLTQGRVNTFFGFGERFDAKRSYLKREAMKVKVKNSIKIGIKYGVKFGVKFMARKAITHLLANAFAPGAGSVIAIAAGR